MLFVLTLLCGVLAGLRAFMPLAAITWAAHLGFLKLDGTWLAFLGYTWTPWIASALALVELVTDQLPSTPSRTVPPQFGARLLQRARCPAQRSGLPVPGWIVGAVLGLIGAVGGTLGGSALRGRLAQAFGRDPPAAFIEDALAILIAVGIVLALR